MSYEYFTPDRVNVLELDKEQMQLVPYIAGYSVALMRRNFELASELMDEGYTFPSAQLLEELLEDELGHVMTPLLIDQYIRSEATYKFRVNQGAFPDSPNDIPLDELTGAFAGALHGAHTFLTNDRAEGYWSPGQVVDIAHYFLFSGMDNMEIGNVALRMLYRKMQTFFSSAADRSEPVFFGYVKDGEEPE